MSDVLVLVFIAVLIVLAVVLTRKKPGTATPEPERKKVLVDDDDDAPAADEAPAAAPVHEIKDEPAHAAEVAALRAANEPPGPKLAGALFRWSIATARAGDMAKALPLMREAAEMPAPDEASRKERLTFQMNLGEMLARTGQLDEAEKVLRESLPGREAAFGRLHAAYAFGLAPLARLLLAKGDFAGASQTADEVVAVLGAARHENLPMGQGLAAAAAIAAGKAPNSPEKVENASLSAYLSGLIDATQVLAPDRAARTLSFGVQVLQERNLLATEAGVQLLDRYGQVTRRAGALDESAAAFGKLAEIAFAQGNGDVGVHAMLGVAVARAEAGDAAGATSAFEQLTTAVSTAPPAVRSRIAREFGLFLTQLEKERALAKLAEAVALGREANDPAVLGVALAAEGVWRHHAGEFDTAAALLEEAKGALPANHPEMRPVASHLEAAKKKGPCDCVRDERLEIERVLNQAMAQALQPDLVRVRVNPGPKGTQYGLEFARQPTQEELDKAKNALENALRAIAAAQQAAKAGGVPNAQA